MLNQVGLVVTATGKDMIVDFKPLAPLLGIAVEDSDTAQTSEAKLAQIIQVSPQLLPVVDRAIDDLEQVIPYLASLHPDIYPETEKLPLRSWLVKAQEQAVVLEEHLPQLRAAVKVFPEVMGEPDGKTYLILFQNDKELRPTGGFITSYALLQIQDGQISISDARNIYEVSSEEAYLPTPEPIVKYLKQPLWRMRDTNFSPDFKNSMETFLLYWNNLQLTPVDGVVALDTQFVSEFLEILGPVEVENHTYDFSVYGGLPEACRVGGVCLLTRM